MCRAYSCEDWYEFGPRSATGYDPGDPVPLDCNRIPETLPEDGVPSLAHRCTSLDPPPIGHGYNRRCGATTSATSAFDCFSIDPDTDFGPFLAEVERCGTGCGPGDGDPFFAYTAIVSQHYPGREYTSFVVAHNGTHEFDRDFAVGGTIRANYSEYPTDSPTVSPSVSPSLSPIAVSGSAREGLSSTQLCLVVVGWWLGMRVSS